MLRDSGSRRRKWAEPTLLLAPREPITLATEAVTVRAQNNGKRKHSNLRGDGSRGWHTSVYDANKKRKDRGWAHLADQ